MFSCDVMPLCEAHYHEILFLPVWVCAHVQCGFSPQSLEVCLNICWAWNKFTTHKCKSKRHILIFITVLQKMNLMTQAKSWVFLEKPRLTPSSYSVHDSELHFKYISTFYNSFKKNDAFYQLASTGLHLRSCLCCWSLCSISDAIIWQLSQLSRLTVPVFRWVDHYTVCYSLNAKQFMDEAC